MQRRKQTIYYCFGIYLQRVYLNHTQLYIYIEILSLIDAKSNNYNLWFTQTNWRHLENTYRTIIQRCSTHSDSRKSRRLRTGRLYISNTFCAIRAVHIHCGSWWIGRRSKSPTTGRSVRRSWWSESLGSSGSCLVIVHDWVWW